MKRRVKIIAVILLLAAVFANTVSAKSISFHINKGSGTNGWMTVNSNTKDRTNDTWQMETLDNSTTTFKPGKCVINFQVYNSNNTSANSRAYLVDNFGYSANLLYYSVPANTATVWLRAKIDSTSSEAAFFYVGQWYT